MAFEEQLPQWENEGTQPPQSKRVEGWLPNEKPPASWFNWLFHRTYKALQELQQKAVEREEFESHAPRHAAGGPDAITPSMIGAAPISHGSEHNHDGSDPIPDLVQLREGVIVESGENANGHYVRFADGTQICWTRKTGVNINLNIAQQDYPYPANFVSDPTTPFGISTSFVVSDAVRNALRNSFVTGSNTQWSVRIPAEARTEDSADGATGYHLIAIGRWM
mgnify:CR=1 FL=1